ncbi:hypothetical protein PIB30_101659, partial [Stylosanthes scabra]|nr:hypothetical protein [Stylosanthes scabra]
MERLHTLGELLHKLRGKLSDRTYTWLTRNIFICSLIFFNGYLRTSSHFIEMSGGDGIPNIDGNYIFIREFDAEMLEGFGPEHSVSETYFNLNVEEYRRE